MENTQNNSANNSAKFAFFYMLSLASLVFMSLAAGMIIFQIINKNIVDVLEQFRGSYSPDQLKFAISALIISAPIFYVAMSRIYKSLFSGELDKDSGVRKWLTYFILLVSSIVMIGWLIATINSFLDGELTGKFILKSITAIVIAAAIFTFYFYDIKRDVAVGEKNKIILIYFYASLAAVIAVFAASLFFVESPQETRNRKLDNMVLDKFNQIDNAVNTYYQENKKLPGSLELLAEEFPYLTNEDLADAATGKKFGYKPGENNSYELCADFRTSSKGEENDAYNNFYKENWPHDAGYQCLKQKVRDKNSGELMPL
ncbi:hypothetical protein KKC83_04750 [Patescibacteria group bacterium]|nr:hypothetical protein [Candidatus Falkowbacteria bacterium]MBU3905409.1 hypothetical protein [Patescibacteria group bacterium]MBU4015041.1 hypothetical protein [Patescibacteria group bacterium]MBU4026826.1 hypothetical protein [Patescibacteria group bacterium]MBU4073363.1 hypothetical protein [Patescibacteria group bacterium]